jgi:predicted RNA-binding protein with RPS1 domain
METKIVKLINGDDLVTKFAKEQLGDKSPLLRLEKPLQIKYVSQFTTKGFKDYIALIKWAGYTNDVIVTIPKDKIMSITNATNEMQKSYLSIAKNYDRIQQKPDRTPYESQELTEEENKKFNELWDEFRDDEEDDKTYH